MCSFLGLVVIARAKHPAPSRTRSLSAAAPMVLRLKTWESRSLPSLERNMSCISLPHSNNNACVRLSRPYAFPCRIRTSLRLCVVSRGKQSSHFAIGTDAARSAGRLAILPEPFTDRFPRQQGKFSQIAREKPEGLDQGKKHEKTRIRSIGFSRKNKGLRLCIGHSFSSDRNAVHALQIFLCLTNTKIVEFKVSNVMIPSNLFENQDRDRISIDRNA